MTCKVNRRVLIPWSLEGAGTELAGLMLPGCVLKISELFSLKERTTNFSPLHVLTMYRFCFLFCPVTSRLSQRQLFQTCTAFLLNKYWPEQSQRTWYELKILLYMGKISVLTCLSEREAEQLLCVTGQVLFSHINQILMN